MQFHCTIKCGNLIHPILYTVFNENDGPIFYLAPSFKIYLQDWFNSRLKQVVFELTNRSLGGSTSPPGVQLDMPDGGSASRLGMTSPGGVDALLDPDQNLDLME